MGFKQLFTASLGLLGGCEALKTHFTIKELKEVAALDAKLNAKYSTRDTDPSLLYPARYLDVPIDHFHNDSLYEPHTNETFKLRYWFDPSHYKEGGPVIVLQSGETSGVGRLPFLQKGIVAQLAEATGGLGVILEHRYYGTSFPVSDLSIESLRFLTTDQALADMAYFAKNVVYEGLEDFNLTAPNTAYIAYGGSYAGAFVAFLRKIYPEIYWGAISSSGVTEAIWDYWQYFEAARLFAPGDCAITTQKLTNVIDNILIGKNGTEWVDRIKTVYGLGNVTRSDDFVNSIDGGIYGLQSTNWDPTQNDTSYGEYCDTVSSDSVVYAGTEPLRTEVTELLDVAGYADEADVLTNRMLNYIGWINSTVVVPCASTGASQDECFTSYAPDFYRQDDISQTWRAWPWQYCTEWGYLQTGSGYPPDILPPISRLVDIEFSTIICRDAFNISTPAKVERINQWGGFYISYPRLAIVDGEKDPWRAATPHAIGINEDRASTISQPFILIKDGVHHWDENGLFPNETTAELPPAPVKEAQAAEVKFVKQWMQAWKYKDQLERPDEL